MDGFFCFCCAPPVCARAHPLVGCSAQAQVSWLAFEPGAPPQQARPAQAAHAHLLFTTSAAAIEFSSGVDGAPFRDRGGNSCRLAVEWALNQRVATRERRPDNREGTIVNDEARSLSACLDAAAVCSQSV